MHTEAVQHVPADHLHSSTTAMLFDDRVRLHKAASSAERIAQMVYGVQSKTCTQAERPRHSPRIATRNETNAVV
eukprot:18262-Heterococcus_DN1.PRE.3